MPPAQPANKKRTNTGTFKHYGPSSNQQQPSNGQPPNKGTKSGGNAQGGGGGSGGGGGGSGGAGGGNGGGRKGGSKSNGRSSHTVECDYLGCRDHDRRFTHARADCRVEADHKAAGLRLVQE